MARSENVERDGAIEKKNNAREAAIWALHPSAVRICVDSAGEPEISRCTTSRATIRDVLAAFVGLGGLKNEKKKVLTCTTEGPKIVGHGTPATTARLQLRRPWQLFL